MDGIWTYSLDEVWKGLKGSYRDLAENVKQSYGVTLTHLKALGISGMMHGYMAFDEDDNLLVPFRTWRNNNHGRSFRKALQAVPVPHPQRWSIAHLYQAISERGRACEPCPLYHHPGGLRSLEADRGEGHGIGEASGMFPIDIGKKEFNQKMLSQFDELVADKGFPWKISEILPKVLVAGEIRRRPDGGRSKASG